MRTVLTKTPLAVPASPSGLPGLRRVRVSARAPVPAEHRLQVLGVDVTVALLRRARLQVEPAVVQQAARARAPAEGDLLLVVDVNLTVRVRVTLQVADGDVRVATERQS